MKKTNKVISIVLALMLAFSSVPLMASASAVPDTTASLETIIQTQDLANLLGWLVTNLNNRKDAVTGTVLRYVLFAVKNPDIQAGVGERDPLALTDEEAAEVVVTYLGKVLKEKTVSIMEKDWIIKLAEKFGITLKLDTVDGALATIASVCDKVDGKGIGDIDVGDLNGLNGSALKGVTIASKGNIGVIKALVQWLNDNIEIIKNVLINSTNKTLNLGKIISTVKADLATKVCDKVSGMISPEAIREKIYTGLKLDTAAFAASAYKEFTADELLAAKFVTLIEDDVKVVSKTDADKILGYTLYDFFTKYAEKAYAKYLVPQLNRVEVKNFLKTINVNNTFNLDYEFTKDSFSDIFTTGKNNGFVEQLNDVICRILETMLTADAYKELALTNGGNENLDANFNKVLKYVLPIMAKQGTVNGFDFSGFTAEAVKDMSTEDMVVAVLKIFYPGWFHYTAADTFEMNVIKEADTIEKLLVLAVYFAIDNDKWVPFMTADKFTALIFDGESFKDIPDIRFMNIAFDMAVELGAKALDYNKKTTRFVLPAEASGWNAEEYADEIVDWAIEMVKGLPAIADILPAVRGKLDTLDNEPILGGFYKLNVILNNMIDLSFFTGCGKDTFAFDIRTMLVDKFLKSFCDFKVKDAVDILSKNENATIFNKQLIPAVIDTVDDLLTSIFEYKAGPTASRTIEFSCTKNVEIEYDAKNGNYLSVLRTEEVDHHDWKTTTTNPTCITPGKIVKVCSICGETIIEEIPVDSEFGHKYENGVCIYCGEPEPGTEPDPEPEVPTVKTGDVDGDDKITASDARLALRASVNLETLSETAEIAANVDGDDKITASDARLILRVSVNLDSFDE